MVTQVVYPALDAKVKNVTGAYSHEHRDEVWGRGAAIGPSSRQPCIAMR